MGTTISNLCGVPCSALFWYNGAAMITARELSRHFGDIVAVDRLSFEIATGEVLGFLGPNGAGKTTAMRMITGFLAPTSGSVSVCGHDVASDALAARRHIGYLPEGAPCYADMAVCDFLCFIAEARGLRGRAVRLEVAKASEMVDLGAVAEQRILTLSKGYRRRVGLAQALLNSPPVLILDEPTDGLDPNQKDQVRRLIAELGSDRLVVISTHILEEIDAVCNRVMILVDGRIAVDTNPAELRRRSRWHNAVRLRLLEERVGLEQELSSIAGVAELLSEEPGRHWVLFAEGRRSLLPAVRSFVERNSLPVQTLQVEPGRLDDVFHAITKGKLA